MNQPENVLRMTESVCPVCLEKIPARHVQSGGDIYLQKTCDKHGDFSAVIWRGNNGLDYHTWKKEKIHSHPRICLTEPEKGCPFDCGLCTEHRQQTCCVVLEVTERCNLNCNYCYAGGKTESTDPSFEKVKEWLEYLAALGRPFIHLSGGEPTVREDLPEIIRMAKKMGFPYIQLNTNGIRLGHEPKYARKLKEAGLSSVFMQFDGTEDEVYWKLRGCSLMAEKENAIRNCGECQLGVVLVPTVVPGINDGNIGGIVNYALERIPVVRGIHFQPVSYLGRYPAAPPDEARITLPEVVCAIESQTDGRIKAESIKPSGCDHARCGFYADFVQYPDGSVRPLPKADKQSCCCSPGDPSAVEKNRSFVAKRWVRDGDEENSPDYTIDDNSLMENLDYFLSRVHSHGFSITGMAFQDCWNIDLERLQECSLHVFSPDGRIIPFCAYNLSSMEGESLHRKPDLAGIDLVDRTVCIKKAQSDKTGGTDKQNGACCCGTEKKTEGCLVCGKELVYSEKSSKGICLICGKEYVSNMRCIEGHFICDQCHSADILQKLERFLLASTEVNPLNLIQQVFELPGLNMHGPEYHSIVPAVLVAACQNLDGKKDGEKIKESIKRGAFIKGGGCGYYGTCGAAVGTGIAASVLDDVTPMSVDKRSRANTVTGLALLDISKHGGPRCCKRETVTAIKSFMRNTDYFRGMTDLDVECKQYKTNKDCIRGKCPYFPKKLV